MSALAETPSTKRMIGGLHVEAFGPEDAPALLFSAGLGGGGGYWMPQVEAFAGDHRVILYDHRGTGRSARSELPRPYTISHLAADMVMLLDGLGLERAHVVGHAAGGIAALELARMAPDRVASIGVVNGWASADPHLSRCFAIRRGIYEAGGADAYLMAQPLFLYPAAWISDHLADLDADRAHHLAGFQDQATLYARMASLEAFDIREHLPQIGCPVLLVVAEDDMLVPARASRLLADSLPHAQLVTLPQGGHAINITASSAFNAALRGFLDDLKI